MIQLVVEDLVVRFGFGNAALTAVDGVNLIIPEGATLGLVGESGCGKSTVARAIVQLVPSVSGRILLDGADLANARGDKLSLLRKSVQMVFQDPYSSLNPRMTVGEILDEAIRLHCSMSPRERSAEIMRLLNLVALNPLAAGRYPHQFSGGQRQRVAIARTLAVHSRIIILDEVTSSLDVSVQANILNLLKKLQRELGLSYLFISHNLSVVRYMSDVVSVMYLGQIVERAPVRDLFEHPRHPYTKTLIDSVPKMQAGGSDALAHLSGEIPDPHHPPSGCRFRTRCPVGPNVYPDRTTCIELDPHRAEKGNHTAACHFPLDQRAVEVAPVPRV